MTSESLNQGQIVMLTVHNQLNTAFLTGTYCVIQAAGK